MSSVTELEGILEEVAKLGVEDARLAEHLRRLRQDFRKDRSLGVLEKIR